MDYKKYGIKKYRNIKSRCRVYAIQYKGDNAGAVQEFIELPVYRTLGDDSYINCMGRIVNQGEYIAKTFVVVGDKTFLDVDFEIYEKKIFEKKFRESGEKNGIKGNNREFGEKTPK